MDDVEGAVGVGAMLYSVDGDVLVVQGALDVRCTAVLREQLYALLDQVEAAGGTTVVVDLSAVDSVDMTALKLLAVANRVARRRGVRVVLRGVSSGVRRLTHLTHLRSVLTLEPAVRPDHDGVDVVPDDVVAVAPAAARG